MNLSTSDASDMLSLIARITGEHLCRATIEMLTIAHTRLELQRSVRFDVPDLMYPYSLLHCSLDFMYFVFVLTVLVTVK